jgi:Zn-finger nucleic acid-binding protein
MALCPQCDHSVLVHTLLTDNLAGYSCGHCLGTLVSLVAYRVWRERSEGNDLPTSTPMAEPESAPPDSIGAKKCPKCRSLMSKYRIRSDKTNRLDYCPHCEEIWLDEGEWRLVEGLVASGEFTKVFTQAWQYAVRAGVTAAMEEERLRELLGGDYERVAEFAEWVQSQPARAEILARLGRIRR